MKSIPRGYDDPAPEDLTGFGNPGSLLELAGIGAVAVSALIMTFLLVSLSPAELLGPHPALPAIVAAAVMTIGGDVAERRRHGQDGPESP